MYWACAGEGASGSRTPSAVGRVAKPAKDIATCKIARNSEPGRSWGNRRYVQIATTPRPMNIAGSSISFFERPRGAGGCGGGGEPSCANQAVGHLPEAPRIDDCRVVRRTRTTKNYADLNGMLKP